MFLLAPIFRTKTKRAYQAKLNGIDVWIKYVGFESIREELLIHSNKRLANSYDVVSAVYKLHNEVKTVNRKKESMKKLWKQIEGGGHGSNKKYPYGSSIARREAPANYIHIVRG